MQCWKFFFFFYKRLNCMKKAEKIDELWIKSNFYFQHINIQTNYLNFGQSLLTMHFSDTLVLRTSVGSVNLNKMLINIYSSIILRIQILQILILLYRTNVSIIFITIKFGKQNKIHVVMEIINLFHWSSLLL